MNYIPYLIVFVSGLALTACGAPPAPTAEPAVAADSEFEIVNGVKTKKRRGL